MKQQQALTAFTTIIALGKRVTGKTAFALFQLKSKLKPIVDFQSEEEMKLIEKHNGTLGADGLVKFDSDDERKAFIDERKELGSMEIEPGIEPVTIKLEQIPNINLEEIEALNGFVIFE